MRLKVVSFRCFGLVGLLCICSIIYLGQFSKRQHGRGAFEGSQNCTSWMKDTVEENLKVIKNYPRGIADKYMFKISGNLMKPKKTLTSFPVIVTASDKQYYMASQGLIKSIREKLPKNKDIQLIYYDLGLTKKQKEQLIKYCKCEVRDFNFDDFPPHVKQLKWYTWKPLIVKQVLMEYGWVWWCDSSVRFLGADPERALQYSKDNSVFFVTYANIFPTAVLTDIRTFEFFQEDICKYRYLGQLEANFLLFYFDHVTDIIVDQWAICALNEDCMAPRGAKLGCDFSKLVDGLCHRYDQSVLSIMLRRVFNKEESYPVLDYYKGNNSLYELRRRVPVHYFPEQC